MICWDAIAHTDLWVVQLNGKAQCVAMSPDGLAYAVGDLYLQYLLVPQKFASEGS